MGESILKLQQIRKSFDHTEVLKGVDLEVAQGEFITLLGASGCGKTTTLNMIGGFLAPDSGTILLDGQDVTNMPPERRPVSTVFQSYGLFPHMTVLENVTYGLKFRRYNRAQAREKGMKYLELVGLADRANAHIHEISGGQQQRVSIARAIITEPSIVLADEPTGNLDSRTGQEVMELLCEIFRERNTTFILSSHDPQMERYTDRTVYFSDGKIETENHHTGEENAQ